MATFIFCQVPVVIQPTPSVQVSFNAKTGIQSYECSVCGTVSTDKMRMVCHAVEKMHMDETYCYNCPACNNVFQWEKNMTHHMKACCPHMINGDLVIKHKRYKVTFVYNSKKQTGE